MNQHPQQVEVIVSEDDAVATTTATMATTTTNPTTTLRSPPEEVDLVDIDDTSTNQYVDESRWMMMDRTRSLWRGHGIQQQRHLHRRRRWRTIVPSQSVLLPPSAEEDTDTAAAVVVVVVDDVVPAPTGPVAHSVAAVSAAAAAVSTRPYDPFYSSDDETEFYGEDSDEDSDAEIRRYTRKRRMNSGRGNHKNNNGMGSDVLADSENDDPMLDRKPAAKKATPTDTTKTRARTTSSTSSLSDVSAIDNINNNDDDDEVQMIDVDRNVPLGSDQSYLPTRIRRRPQQPSNDYPDIQEVGPDGKALPPSSSIGDALTSKPKSGFIQVLDIFPDVDVAHLIGMLSEYQENVELIVSILSENNYPKDKSTESTASAFGTINNNGTIHHGGGKATSTPFVIQRRNHPPEPKYDYSSINNSASRTFDPSSKYLREAMLRLVYDFPFMKVNAIRFFFKQHHYRYTITRQHIQDRIVGKITTTTSTATTTTTANDIKQKKADEEEMQFKNLRAVVDQKQLSSTVRDQLGCGNCKVRWNPTIKSNKSKKTTSSSLSTSSSLPPSQSPPPPVIEDDILKDEIYHFELQYQCWMEKVQQRINRKSVRLICQERGTLVECGICYDTVPLSEMVPCKDHEHLFCTDCMVSLVETAVFSNGTLGTNKETKRPAHEILCCHESGCQSGFRDDFLHKILPEKTWEQYCELQGKAVIELAGLGDTLGSCPKCGYHAFLPETEMIFTCPVQDCRFASCRKCGDVPHIPLRCEEAAEKRKQERNETGRLAVEEALSNAKIRICPKCKKKSIKSEGCNKISCPCGMKFCYTCRAPLDKVGYAHFCSTPHCDHTSCQKCKLHSNFQEDDDLAMKEAGITALQRYKAEIHQQQQEQKQRNTIGKGGKGGNNNQNDADDNGGGDDDDDDESLNIDLNQLLHDPSRPGWNNNRPLQHNNNVVNPIVRQGAGAALPPPPQQQPMDDLLRIHQRLEITGMQLRLQRLQVALQGQLQQPPPPHQLADQQQHRMHRDRLRRKQRQLRPMQLELRRQEALLHNIRQAYQGHHNQQQQQQQRRRRHLQLPEDWRQILERMTGVVRQIETRLEQMRLEAETAI